MNCVQKEGRQLNVVQYFQHLKPFVSTATEINPAAVAAIEMGKLFSIAIKAGGCPTNRTQNSLKKVEVLRENEKITEYRMQRT